jgi:hypothetical protein
MAFTPIPERSFQRTCDTVRDSDKSKQASLDQPRPSFPNGDRQQSYRAAAEVQTLARLIGDDEYCDPEQKVHD